MKGVFRLVAILLCATGVAHAADQARLLEKVTPLPTALSNDFEFRKVKLFLLGKSTAQTGNTTKKKYTGRNPTRATAVIAEASINFEPRYRTFGAVTSLDQRERSGNYLDFYWRANREADLTVRLEYRQELLHAFVQGREIRYPHARGHHRTEFAIVGDEFFDDGRITAWRCLLIENGHIVAEKRSYLWQ